MGKISLFIDGIQIQAEEGMSVLEAALAADIYIPHLCSHPDLPATGGCKMCVVEIDGEAAPVSSCVTEVREGMHVTTKSEKLKQLRKIALELIMAGHPHDCTGCRAYGNCELQAMWQYLGVLHARMKDEFPEKTTLKIGTGTPVIIRENDRCIQCGRCVRACGSLRKVGAIDYQKKGLETYISTPEDLPLNQSTCRFCSACVEVCPTGALVDMEGLFRSDLPREQALVPCQAECPAHIDIPAFLRFIAQGKYDEAHAVMHEKVPFPHSLGYVCNHRCETGCKREKLNRAISICSMKRFAAEHDETQLWKQNGFQKPDTGKKIAVVGGGPCGMTAAYYLKKLGHDVTVYEKDPIAGGHMAKGMPEFRIPGADVAKEIQDITDIGVKLLVNSPVENVAELKKDYDAVLVTIGTSVGKKLNYLPGSNFRNVYTAVQLLKDNRLKLAVPGYEMKLDLGKQVCIIGGGNVSIDCARTLRRMGCEVNIVCLEKGEKMLADKQEIQEALEEGVKFYDGHSNEAIEGTEEQVTGLRVHEVESFYFDENRNLVENQVPDSTKVLPCDSVVFASGQVTGLTADFGLELNRFGYPIDPETGTSGFKTSIPGVFTAGDVITGTKFVIDAIAGAREVTAVIDQFLGGDGSIDERLVERTLNPELGPIEGFGLEPRVETIVVDPETRMSPEYLWDKVDQNFTCEMAQCEAGRCLQCDLRVPIRKVENFNAYSKR